MSKFRVAIQTSIFALLVLGTCTLVQAQATRTWVSGVGDDVNPCSRTAPCKTFAGAISKTATNGEINCLDPAGYGAVTITKSITIDCEDTQGSILSAGTNGIIVNITAVTDTRKAVMIRGVSINGAGSGINGIRVLAGLTMTLDEVVIQGVNQHGISIETSAAGTFRLLANNTIIRNGNNHGINAFPIGGSVVQVAFNGGGIFHNTGNGFNFADNVRATATGTIFQGNNNGILASNAQVFATDCTIYNNTTGITASNGGTVRIKGNTITGNGTGITGSTITSVTGTNSIIGNTVDGSPTNSIAGV